MARRSRQKKVSTLQDIRKVSRATAAALDQLGLKCYLFGSAACSMYGMRNRIPNDVDVVVSAPNWDVEEIKERIVDVDDNFYLVDSANPRAAYRVLHYSIPSGSRAQCKVDVLVPGDRTDLHIPRIPIREIQYTNVPGVPVMPYLPLLLMKLQGWTEHRESNQRRFVDKVPADEDDIHEMLRIGVDNEVTLYDDGEEWLPGWFIEQARDRVDEFVYNFPRTRKQWRRIGFDV